MSMTKPRVLTRSSLPKKRRMVRTRRKGVDWVKKVETKHGGPEEKEKGGGRGLDCDDIDERKGTPKLK